MLLPLSQRLDSLMQLSDIDYKLDTMLNLLRVYIYGESDGRNILYTEGKKFSNYLSWGFP